jgi:hypothetical protein
VHPIFHIIFAQGLQHLHGLADHLRFQGGESRIQVPRPSDSCLEKVEQLKTRLWNIALRFTDLNTTN